MGADAIRKLAKYETKTVAENYAKNVAGSYLAEAETGGLQSVFTNTLNETVNLLKGEEVFDPKTAGEIVGDFLRCKHGRNWRLNDGRTNISGYVP